MQEIYLTQGKVAIIDDKHLERVSERKWRYMSVGYAATGNGTTQDYITLHNFIKGPPPLGFIWHHVDGDGLNNQENNLILATFSQNQAATDVRKSNTSGYRGVYLNSRGKWAAYIDVNKKRRSLGSYDDIHEAARAYNKAALQHFGNFAKLNIITSCPLTS